MLFRSPWLRMQHLLAQNSNPFGSELNATLSATHAAQNATPVTQNAAPVAQNATPMAPNAALTLVVVTPWAPLWLRMQPLWLQMQPLTVVVAPWAPLWLRMQPLTVFVVAPWAPYCRPVGSECDPCGSSPRGSACYPLAPNVIPMSRHAPRQVSRLSYGVGGWASAT